VALNAFTGSYSDGDAEIYHASMGSQASQYGFGPPMARLRKGTFQSSFDPSVRMKAGPNFQGRVCPNGHMCEFRTYRKSNRSCDVCEKEIAVGLMGERCFVCDYDLCPDCSSTLKVSENVDSKPSTVDGSSITSATNGMTVPLAGSVQDHKPGTVDGSSITSARNGMTVPLAGPVQDDVYPAVSRLHLTKLFPIFHPRQTPHSISVGTGAQAASLAVETTGGKILAERSGETSHPHGDLHPVWVPMIAPVRRLQRLKLRKQAPPSMKELEPLSPSSPLAGELQLGVEQTAGQKSDAPAPKMVSEAELTKAAGDTVVVILPAGTAVSASPSKDARSSAAWSSEPTVVVIPSESSYAALPASAGPALRTPSRSVAGLPPRPPRQSAAALSLPTAYGSPPQRSTVVCLLPQITDTPGSPDSPVSRLEAFQTMCRLHPDKRFGVSIGIQCCSPDPLFVDLRVPRTSDNFRDQLAPFGNRDEPTFENPVPVAVNRGWQSARSLGNMQFKKLEIFVQHAQVVRMPRDGSCLYHALIHYANAVCGANLSILQLRKELVGFVRQHCELVIHGQPLQTWIKWECQCRYI
jgi:hypothetical protein